jgi:hypothetical protein
VTEAEHLPDRKVKSDTELAIDVFVDDILERMCRMRMKQQRMRRSRKG